MCLLKKTICLLFSLLLIGFSGILEANESSPDTQNRATGEIPPHIKASGIAQKGGFLGNSIVQASSLEISGLTATTKTRKTSAWTMSIPWTGATLIEVSGKYFNECTGANSTTPIKLRSFIYGKDKQTVKANTNLFTHFVSVRADALTKNGMTHQNANKKAIDELKNTLKFKQNPANLDLYDGSGPNKQDNANLLLFSGAFACQGNANTILDTLSNDFKDNGFFDGPSSVYFRDIQLQAGKEGFKSLFSVHDKIH